MDPYLERPQRWPGFHNALVVHIEALLQPLLKPKYVAVGQERVYVAQARLVWPDVAIRRRSRRQQSGGVGVAELEPDAAKLITVVPEEVQESYLEIVDPSDITRIVTAIEVLSPKNKRAGAGRKSYLQKRRELWQRGANLVEIDLLRAGRSLARLDRADLDELRPFHYLVAVSRHEPRQQEVYSVTVRQRLPRVAIPLGAQDPDVTLDLQGAFARTWEQGPYPELLRYDGPPPGPMGEEDAAWCARLARKQSR
jgi:hypothetical protein